MQVELSFTNEQRVLPGAKAFVEQTLAQMPLAVDDARRIGELALGAVRAAIDGAYPAGEEGLITLALSEREGKLEIIVRDFGLPRDVAHDEQSLHSAESKTLFGVTANGAVDEMHWLGYGPQGKAFQMIRWLHDQHVSEIGALEPFDHAAELAPPQQYQVRRLQADDALQVSQLMYRAYGGTYFNEDVYYPERIAAQNEHGTLASFVAVAESGEVVGHYALEFNQPGPVAEVGQAVVNPAHRQRGLLNRMKDAALEFTQHQQLAGWYADAVCVHPYTQKSNAEHGGHLCGVDLGISPQSEAFRGFAEQTERVSCMLYFHWLIEPAPRTVHVPDRHREMVARIYKNLQCECDFGASRPAAGHGSVTTHVDDAARRAFVRVDTLGEDTAHAILRARRELVEHARAETVFAELPASNPAAPSLIEQLEQAGFGFCGNAPHFAAAGDLLRMVYQVQPLTRGPIQVYEPFGEELLDYVLAEQARVQAEL